MENDSLESIKKQYVAAMSREMKSPLYKIMELVSGENSSSDRSIEIKEATRYLLSLVDELSEFAQVKP